MRVSEIFHSIQGEGIYAGLPMTFIRFQFCPFNCSYCDTKYAQGKVGGQEMQVDEIVSQVRHKWVCITGGEPLSQPRAFTELVKTLKGRGHRITVETSGLVPLPCLWDLRLRPHAVFSYVDSWSVDVKCPSSGYACDGARTFWPNLRYLRLRDQVKFVVGSAEDLLFTEHVLRQYPGLPNVLISPVWGVNLEEACVEFVKSHEDTRLSLQLHKILWGERKGV